MRLSCVWGVCKRFSCTEAPAPRVWRRVLCVKEENEYFFFFKCGAGGRVLFINTCSRDIETTEEHPAVKMHRNIKYSMNGSFYREN